MKKRNISVIAQDFRREAVVPFWMWNDHLEQDELKRQLHEIKEKGMNQVIIHPRFGLETPYLSDEWFEMVGFVVKEAEREEMKLWIYDELNWPSGYAGGEVLEKDPNLCAKHLIKTSQGYQIRETSWKPAYSDDRYIDVLNPDATDTFIDLVYEKYWKRFKKHFGKTIVGFFTDEPGMYNNFADSDPDSIPWTDKLSEFFEKVNGYPLEKSLDFIFEIQGHKSIESRVDYWKTISQLYQESYFKRLQEWCHKRGVAFIGHVLIEEDMVNTAKTQGNFFATMKHLDFAGYDLLGRLEPKALIAAKLASSASKVFNLYGVTAETFGIFGWDLTKKEMERVVKWQAEQGLNVLIPHAFYYSLRGERYSDCPPSFMTDKFWSDFEDFVEHSRKQLHEIEEERPRVAIYYPIESIWGYLSPNDTEEAEKVDRAFQATSYACYNIGVEFDYIPESFLDDDILINYQFLILPKTEVMPLVVMKKLVQFVKSGGRVICVDGKPEYSCRVSEQNTFDKTWKKLGTSVEHIDLHIQNSNQVFMDHVKTNVKNWLQQNVPPIWLARGIRVAKILGYKKPISVNQITGIEEQLERIIRS